ncbi:MAG: pyridoxamine kinase [Desulfovibrio sp.]|jgi:pyridoxine kinase|nr:pyridoxamine kinase [Desulfovibrio sp.]
MRPVPCVAAIHDLSGFGRTSLTVVIPVFSTMGIQVCPLPTAVLSTHTTGFTDFRFVDLTPSMQGFLDHWKSLSLRFEAVYSGFLGSAAQVEVVMDCIHSCLLPGGIAMVDPVLGDNGRLDPTMTPEMVDSMRQLIRHASCITPNLTEAALLLGEPYPFEAEESGLEISLLRDWLCRLSENGPETTVITSVPLGGDRRNTSVIAYQSRLRRFWQVRCDYVPAFYPGTGDTFTSVLTACLMQGDSLPLAMDRAVQFVTLGIRATFGHDAPTREGIFLERVLSSLRAPFSSTFSLMEEIP